MPSMPCECRSNCPGVPDSPLANLTSEAPDRIVFIGNSWGWNNNVPPIGSDWTSTACYATCESTVSQQDADLCAAQAQLQCLVHTPTGGGGSTTGGGGWTDGSDPDNPIPVPVYQNEPAFCTVPCADGNPFTYTVRAGLFSALDQETADRMAIALACQNARVSAVCLGTLDTNACLNQPYLASITVQGGLSPYSFSIVAGSLPPGVGSFQADANTFFLSGQPSTAGNYNFTLRVTDSRGNFMTKAYTVSVLGITTGSPLPSAQTGVVYSVQLAAAGATGVYTFSLLSGAFPAGLSVSASGLISGTPTNTTTETDSPVIQVADANGQKCSSTLVITSTAPSLDCTTYDFTTAQYGIGLRIKGYSNNLFTNCPFAVPDSGQAWDGTFPVFNSLGSVWSNQAGATSVNGEKFVGANISKFGGTWILTVAAQIGAGPSGLWSGTLVGAQPIGIFVNNGNGCNGLAAPANVTVECYQWRLRIQNFNGAQFVKCPTCLPSGAAAWDGTFPILTGGTRHQFDLNASVSVGGGQQLPGSCNVLYFAGAWGIQLACTAVGPPVYLYQVQGAASADSPIGTYGASGVGGCTGPPGTVYVEAYAV